ncbi:MAG: hypothetical protein WB791_04595 [Waddliaceae bacterium]
MSEEDELPRIVTDFDCRRQEYCALIRSTLRKILPCKFFEIYRKGNGNTEELLDYFLSILPLFTSTSCSTVIGCMTFSVLSRYRKHACKFFIEVISRWQVPTGKIHAAFSYSADFYLPDLSSDLYSLSEFSIPIDSRQHLEVIQRNLPTIASEVRLGIASSSHANRILEAKGLTTDEKTLMIQKDVAHIASRLPTSFSHTLLNEMQQQVLVMSRKEFKLIRGIRHLTRMICIQSLFLQSLRQSVKLSPEKRHVKLKIFKAKLQHTEGKKHVLGVIVAMNFLRDKEVFEERHLIKAIRNYLPATQAVKGSFFFNRRGKEPIETLYLEVEKNNGEEFRGEEIHVLRHELPLDLEGSIEQLMHPVFMPRNEEEIMRNILLLSHQIRFSRDIPQVLISFDEQTDLHVFFTVILVRLISAETLSIEEMFSRSNTFLEYIHDRCKAIGDFRKRYRKEATVFRLKALKEQFLRSNHSIDLYQARRAVVSEIFRIVGEVRDYNGGMIDEQYVSFCKVRELMKDEIKHHELLLENFFYSLNPVIMRTVVEPIVFKKLFLMLVDAQSEEAFGRDEHYRINVRAEPNAVYVIFYAVNDQFQREIERSLSQLNLTPSTLAASCVPIHDTVYSGYVFLCDEPFEQRRFCVTIQHAAEACEATRV